MKPVIAIDPDVKASGFAYYDCQGALIELKNLNMRDAIAYIDEHDAFYVIEYDQKNTALYKRRNQARGGEKIAQAMSVGENKGTAKHLIAAITSAGRDFIAEPPRGGNWGSIDAKIGRAALKQYTGWCKKSNPETRSAAFFGYWKAQQLLVRGIA